MSMVLGLGAVVGVIVAAMCVFFYTKGVRDGMDVKRGVRPRVMHAGEAMEDAAATEISKKFEAILSYDPYAAGRADESEGDEA